MNLVPEIPSIGTAEKPKDHLYVLFAVGMWEGQWKYFERDITNVKLELMDYLRRENKGNFDLSACEIKSNWLRVPKEREKKSPFLHALHDFDRERLVQKFFEQLSMRKMVIIATVIDKRYLHNYSTHVTLHQKAYEFILERIELFMSEYHPKHNALIIMDDTSRELNKAVALKHAYFQRSGNQNMQFRHIVEYPFFARSELSNGIQFADLLAYNVYRAFKDENLGYDYFQRMLLDGLKIWPSGSGLMEKAKAYWETYKESGLLQEV